ncbi:MAG: DUF1194 domain-containing protein [Arenibacterium sp.]
MVSARAIAYTALALLAPVGASACRLALVLAMDVSSSVDAAEDKLQRGGLAAALIAPEVEQAFFASDLPVAISVYEWSGRYNQEVLVDWRLIRGRGDLLDVAETIARSKRSHNDFPTAMGYALGFGAGLLAQAPECLFQVLDMAGDGQNNEGFPPENAYKEFPFGGVTVNGLIVQMPDYQAERSLQDYYRNEVLFGPGAFLEVAKGFADYERAMRRKLERELKPRAVGAVAKPASSAPG